LLRKLKGKDFKMEEEKQVLKKTDLFKDLEPVELEKIASIMQLARVHEGETLTERKQPAYFFYVVISGNFMLSFEEDKAFTIHEPGECMGWATIAAASNYSATSVALTDGEVLCMSGQDFLELIQKDSSIGEKVVAKSCTLLEKRLPFTKVSETTNA
jgi:CRP-like cAMP-binding protein